MYSQLFSLLLLAALSSPPLHAQRIASPRTVWVSYKLAAVYREADYLSEVIDTLVRGDSGTALRASGRFTLVRIGEIEGWVLDANLSRSPVAAAPANPVRATRAKEAARSPARSSDSTKSATPVDTAAAVMPQCAALTRSGKQCSRRANEGSIYCWQHGGAKK